MSPKFARLFSPVTVGSLTFPNRIAMAPMGTSLWTADGLVNDRVKSYYEARAKGGAGMVIIENMAVDFYRGMHHVNRPTIDSDFAITGLADLAHVIKKHGARAVAQINHAGRMAKSKLGGFAPVGPSAIAFSPVAYLGGEKPVELSVDDIHKVIGMFACAAERAVKAGFDAVELHAAHTYLIATFLSPVSNKRVDEYGGTLERRARILVEVLTAIRSRIGQDFPLWCRINGREYGTDEGISLEDTCYTVKKVASLVNAISVSAHGFGNQAHVMIPDSPGALLPLAAVVKKAVCVPVLAAGRLSPEIGEQAITQGQVDIVVIGRGLVADPDLPNKASADRMGDIRPCIACFHCQDVQADPNCGIACTVNPLAGRESEIRTTRAKLPRKVVVIGGGPAGMEAARVLALRGHRPIILERDGRLGGQINLAMTLPAKKERIEPLLTWYGGQLGKLGVEIRLNTEATVTLVRDLRPDMVVLATGATPLIPPLPGMGGRNVVTALEVLAGGGMVGEKAVIVGGGSVGCETAELLSGQGKEVTVIEMLPQLAYDLGSNERFRLLNRIRALPIKVITDGRCCAISEAGVTVASSWGEQEIKAQMVVLAVGMKPRNDLYPQLLSLGLETRLAGDCWRVGNIAQAVSDGQRLACIV